MRILDPGHKYQLQDINSESSSNTLIFYKDGSLNWDGENYAGTCNQEVLRALINRVKFLDLQLEHWVNNQIIHHLRNALILHEIRHLERLLDKNIEVEDIPTHLNGHFA